LKGRIMTVLGNRSLSLEGRGLSRRAEAVKWLRKTHGWIGLWGAVLGLLFGMTGIMQNHRAILKIPAPRPQESTVQLRLPAAAPDNPQALAKWLKETLAIDREPGRIREEQAHPVDWGDRTMQQPAHWTIFFAAPGGGVQADYWVGNGFVTVKRSENGLLATIMSLHKGVGVNPGWILLTDTLGGSIILLSLTGVTLWILTHRRRVIGIAIGGASLAAVAGLAWVSL
jgi:hypothetical protein